ncbi:unnamed protein product [Absidia cylindrospora]
MATTTRSTSCTYFSTSPWALLGFVLLSIISSNNQRGLQIFLEKHHEHRLPCVPLRLDTQISNVEWEWLQTLGRDNHTNDNTNSRMDQGDDDDDDGVDYGFSFAGGGGQYHDIKKNRPRSSEYENHHAVFDINGGGSGISETYDFLTKEMQQRQQQQQMEIQQQLAPFQQVLRQGRRQLQELVGVPIQLKDLFSEDSLCLIDMNTTNSTVKTTLNDLDLDDNHDDDDDDDDDDSMSLPRKTLKKKTLSIADMFTYGKQQTQHGWTRPVHVRMLVIVKPLCVTPDFPVRPNFDFYPYQVFRTLHQDRLQFATTTLESSTPRRQPHHHLSMSDLLNNTIHVHSSLLNSKRPRSSWHQTGESDDDDDYDDTHDDDDEQGGDHASWALSHGSTYLRIGDAPSRHIEKRRSFCTATLITPPSSLPLPSPVSGDYHYLGTESTLQSSSMAMFYQDKDMKGWTGRLLEFDRQRRIYQQQRISPLIYGNDSSFSYSTKDAMKTRSDTHHHHHHQHGTPRSSRITSTCSLPINFDVTSENTSQSSSRYHAHDPSSSTSSSATISKRLKRWWLARRRKN